MNTGSLPPLRKRGKETRKEEKQEHNISFFNYVQSQPTVGTVITWLPDFEYCTVINTTHYIIV